MLILLNEPASLNILDELTLALHVNSSFYVMKPLSLSIERCQNWNIGAIGKTTE